ncbi:hypothetical protein [Bradyrhizobium sp. AZCC 2230]|uniref:hypothetical protein n=1 Tax=Bradyrhizobium sp. AZCC 2230 TaxID=3117021 RepID=UPI002FF203AE
MADGQALKSQRRQQESPVRKRGVFLFGDRAMILRGSPRTILSLRDELFQRWRV